MLNGIVPNLGIKLAPGNARMGRLIEIPYLKTGPMRYKTLMEASIKFEGSRLFNCLPKFIRNLDWFKLKLSIKHDGAIRLWLSTYNGNW